MCRWMGSHFHDWIDYNGLAFSPLGVGGGGSTSLLEANRDVPLDGVAFSGLD